MWKKRNKKMAEALKHIKIVSSKAILSSGKPLDRCIASSGECFEGD